MENFDIVKYLRENHLGSHAILGNYVDLHALKEVEDTEDLEVVKGFGALKDKSVADKYAEVAKQAGMEGVKVIEKDGVFKIYAKAGQKLNKEAEDLKDIETSDLKKGDTVEYEGNEYIIGDFDTAGGANLVYLKTMDGEPAEDSKGRYKKVHKSRVKKLNKEADYGNNQPVDEVPYAGDEEKLDGFGDEFDQVAPVEEAEGSDIVTLSYNDYPSITRGFVNYSINKFKKLVKILGGDAQVVKDEFDKIVFELSGISSEEVKKNFEEKIKDAEIDFDNPFVDLGSWELDTQGDNSVTGDPGWEYTDKDFPIAEEESMNDDDSENPFPSIIDDETANMSHDDKFAYMGGSDIEKAVKSLMANSFNGIEIAQFVVDTIRKFKK